MSRFYLNYYSKIFLFLLTVLPESFIKKGNLISVKNIGKYIFKIQEILYLFTY